MARLPDSFLDALKASCDIASIMSSYVELKRSGRDYVCSCPIHAERTPSCHVYTSTQSFYCFGCGAGGDVINFIRLIEHMDYIDSVKFLAEKVGMSLPTDTNNGGVNVRARLLAMNREAARYFRDVLLSPEGKPGLDYLYARELTPNTIRKYGLGYAPDGWHNLHYYLRGLGYTDDEMEEGALLVRNKKSLYDKFRARVMFPIIDVRGNIIAFGGRTLEKDAKAKYLNSDETMVFHKRDNLFSLNFAKNSKDKFLILCEGYMDVITLNQAGFDTAVATLGTAITSQQANKMKQYAEEVIISYDSDGAGQKATMKAINLLAEAGITAKVLNIPDAKDPDEYIKKFGAESFRHILNSTSTALDHEFGLLQQGIDLSSPSGKAEFLKKAVAFVAAIKSDTERTVYISEAAKISGQPVGAVTDLVKDRKRYDAANAQRNAEREIINNYTKRDPINPDASLYPREEKAERGIIAFMLHSPDLYPRVKKSLAPEDFPTEFNRRVYSFIAENLDNGERVDISLIGSEFEPEETGRVMGMCKQADIGSYAVPQLDDYISVLLDHRGKAAEKPVSEMTDDDLLRLMEEKRKKHSKK